MNRDERITIAFVIIAAIAALGGWTTASHFEAKVFNEITGRDVSTWQAMWVQLRVQDN